MTKASWETYRLGAKIPSLDSLVDLDSKEQISRLQLSLSSVAYQKSSPFQIPSAVPSDDGAFVGRLILGLLCRGWPTHSSPFVEDSLLAAIDPASGLRGSVEGDDASLGWRLHSDFPEDGSTTWDELIRNALLKSDHRLEIDEAEIAIHTDSQAEQRFYREQLAPLLGAAIGWLELQRPIESMLSEDISPSSQGRSDRVDFALELHGSQQLLRIAIELDGPQHSLPEQQQIDNHRDRLLANDDWRTKRIALDRWESGASQHLPGMLRAISEGNTFPFSLISENEEWFSSSRNREASRLILTPHAVARVQFGLTRALMDGSLFLGAPSWVIAVAEREVPCAEIALRDWLQTLDHMCRLYGIPVQTRNVRLLVAEDHLTHFKAPVCNGEAGESTKLIVDKLTAETNTQEIDLAIDVSVGAHPTRQFPTDPLAQPHLLIRNKIVLRTSHRQSGYRVEPWAQPREIQTPMQQRGSLTYFLQYLFRKRDFRTGQLPIINRVLRRQDVIGLLPTGAGKSVTFQLPALLSPGLTLVLDPLKSLMQDQVENLALAGIMDATQINSDTPDKERAKIERQFRAGEYRLVFVSPERLQIKEFRERLQETIKERPVAYFVVDETHCVSEWGHDFRTAYLNLGRIVREYCSRSGERPPIVALTGTASESVLRDIQRELDVADDDAIVRPREFSRKELQFEIVPAPRPHKVGILKRLLEVDIPAKLDMTPDQLASGECGGLIFCPHINGPLGVFEVANKISRQFPRFAPREDRSIREPLVGFYSGEKPKKFEMADRLWSEHKGHLQRSFKSGRTPLLVATKAFGMGIDKPNIRFTVHLAMAQSIEAFAQEAGRAGRDQEDAVCAVLFTDRLAPGKGVPLSSDCLEPGIPVEEANLRAAKAEWDRDDAELQMFLHARSYPGVARESAMVRNFYQIWIEPRCSSGEATADGSVSVTVNEREVKEQLDSLSLEIGSQSLDSAILPANDVASEGDAPKESNLDIQRIFYRLSLLGLVQDYTVNYQPGNNIYTLSVAPLPVGGVREALLSYVRRYRTSERIREVEQYLEASSLDGEVSKSIDALCWFIYQEIEQRRRQGIDNLRQMLRDSSDGADLSRRMGEFLSTNALTQTIFDVLAADDFREWGTIAEQITSSESAEHVYYQCRRALEDAPGHPGLILLQALALLGSDSERRNEVASGLQLGLSRAHSVFSDIEYGAIVDWTVTELSRIAPDSQFQVMSDVILANPESALARVILTLMESSRLPRDPLLARTASRYVLARIDSRIAMLISS